MADTEIPDVLLYSREDEWARVEEGRVTVGVTDYAQQQLGDIVYVDRRGFVPRQVFSTQSAHQGTCQVWPYWDLLHALPERKAYVTMSSLRR